MARWEAGSLVVPASLAAMLFTATDVAVGWRWLVGVVELNSGVAQMKHLGSALDLGVDRQRYELQLGPSGIRVANVGAICRRVADASLDDEVATRHPQAEPVTSDKADGLISAADRSRTRLIAGTSRIDVRVVPRLPRELQLAVVDAHIAGIRRRTRTT